MDLLGLGRRCHFTRSDSPNWLVGEQDFREAVRFAVDAYVTFARTQPWPVAVASSLTELFAPDLMAKRLEAFKTHYSWVQPWGFDYFSRRVTQARKESDYALKLTLAHCHTPALQKAAVDALVFKCEVLWAILDGIAGKFPPTQPIA